MFAIGLTLNSEFGLCFAILMSIIVVYTLTTSYTPFLCVIEHMCHKSFYSF